MTQSLVIQIGQCGNQIGAQFWQKALEEHKHFNHSRDYDEPMHTFFRNVDTSVAPYRELEYGSKVHTLKARAVMIDMEEGVINEIASGPLRKLFDVKQRVTSVSGSGNNWAVGYYTYGQSHREQILDTVRIAAEQCDCLQSFHFLHSMGGGTGSGLGTCVLEMLAEEYPSIYRFVTSVYPSQDDDVVTSPYNTVLAMNQLYQFAHCVMPVENQALHDMVAKIDHQTTDAFRPESAVAASKHKKPWDRMNSIVANMLLNMTCSSRFEGTLNVDVNELTMNLVPYPRMHFLTTSMSPLTESKDVRVAPRRLDQIFTDLFDPAFQLTKCNPRQGTYTSCALLVRGAVDVSDIRRNVDRMKKSLQFARFIPDGWKTGHCSVPPVHQRQAVLCLSNNTSAGQSFQLVKRRFLQLYKKKAYLHHFEQLGVSRDTFQGALENLSTLLQMYSDIEKEQQAPMQQTTRLRLV
eukprot:m.245266 g.245266  ORF g.245266 m.245266 type:complete len:463 (-) comp15363_c0_seq2:310-1698(-)